VSPFPAPATGRRRLVGVLALLLAALAMGCATSSPPGPAAGATPTDPSATSADVVAPQDGGAPAVVTHLVDGDTLDVRLQGGTTERVRLIGIDTPETKKPNTPVQCYGPEASARLAQLVPVGTAVALLADVEARDRYGRFLAYVFRRADGLFVNLAMVEGGFAHVLRIEPNTAFSVDFSQATATAQRAGRGLWSACPTS
jgi:micrococcal nuclease